MSSSPVFVAGYRNQFTQIINDYGPRPRVLWAPQSVPPGSSALGSRIHSISVAQTDASNANSLQLGMGRALTLASNMGSPAVNYNGGGANNDTITRTTGSFVADGWREGQRILVQGATTVANDNVSIINVSGVTALTLTLTPSVFTMTEALPSGAMLINLLLLGDISVPAAAGSSTTVPAVSGLSTIQIPAIYAPPDNFLILGPNDLLVGAAGTGMSAGKTMDITVGGGDY